MRFAIALVALAALGTFVAGDARALDIQVAPQMLVVSSGGSNLTVHTNFPGWPDSPESVILEITPAGGIASEVPITAYFLDDCGYFVVRCDRLAAANAVGAFDGKQTTATVTLTIEGVSGSEVISVKK